MKALLLGAMMLGLVPAPAMVSFEAGGVRLCDSVITDSVLQFKDLSGGHLLVSRDSVEPLSKAVAICLTSGCTLVLEPGVRVTRAADGFALSAHNRRRIELEVAGGKTMLVVPVTIELTAVGMKVAGMEYKAGEITARRPQQDDVDQNLNQLNNAARRIQQSGPNAGSKKDAQDSNRSNNAAFLNPNDPNYKALINRLRWLRHPLTNQMFINTEAILALFHASPIGY